MRKTPANQSAFSFAREYGIDERQLMTVKSGCESGAFLVPRNRDEEDVPISQLHYKKERAEKGKDPA